MERDSNEPVSAGYLATVLALMLILPLVSIALARAAQAPPDGWTLVGSWFLFLAVGVRLLTAGARQVIQPSFTAREIFHLESRDAQVIVRELGFANLCMGLAGIVSLFVPAWRPCAACTGGLYFAIAGLMHVFKRPATPNEWIALLSDLWISAVLLAWSLHQLRGGSG